MAEFLEAAMLLCFGLSWPISLYKNIRLKSAKSMNVCFTLLILAGYLAGIAAKCISGRINYVLAIYVVNLLVVSGNIVVYFINKRYDEKREGENYVCKHQ